MIYVVDVDHMSLAFAAESERQAARIARSPRFARAVGRPCLNPVASNNQPRIATVQERIGFHDMSAEFADAAADILVARIG
ncbi:hypothetical protein [Bradyrhizobium sp. NAS80.1]|uniref:hypothetical protein n=1 Tax=Bradyrhizobium sp. NAS80.1 TaxID=1680159 RepID=UPI001160E4C1|nr:hypothetical protein [Bradyrhizobium sp. NAS80.1]